MTEVMATADRTISFAVQAEPVPMARPRVAVRGGKPHAYVPTGSAMAAYEIRQAALSALGDAAPLSGPVVVTATAYVRMPASIPKRDRLTALPVRRPDLDNHIKTLLDGLSPLWGDDAQVVDLLARKRYAVTGSPRWEVVVQEIYGGD